MPAGLPDLRRHDDGGFEAGDVVALAGHAVPPEFLHVALEFRAERAVIPKAVDAAVNFRRLKNEAPPLAQRHDFFHLQILFWFGHRNGQFSTTKQLCQCCATGFPESREAREGGEGKKLLPFSLRVLRVTGCRWFNRQDAKLEGVARGTRRG